MIRKGVAATIVLGFAAVSLMVTAAVAAPGAPLGVAQALGAPADLASFWGRPYPSGYRYGHPYTYESGFRDPCFRPVRVPTPWGWRWRPLWICS
jgi:hypothetical protein